MAANGIRNIVVFLAWALLAAVAARAGEVAAEFEETTDLLRNPDCGWIAYNYEDSYALRRKVAGGNEPFDLAVVMYTRHVRKAWGDTPEAVAASAPVRLLEDWMANGRHVAFRIYANQLTDLPEGLRGEASFEYEGAGRRGRAIEYWSERYIEDHRQLVETLGKRWAASPRLAFVDIGGVGNTGGEWFFAPAWAFRRAGLDDDRFFELLKRFVEMYRENFPGVRLFISYECVAKAGRRRRDATQLLVDNDIGVRDDGLGGWPYPRRAPSRYDWPIPMLAEKLPVLFEGGGRGGGVYGWKLQGKDPKAVLMWAFERAGPAYINLGGSETASQKACDEMRDLLRNQGRFLGYRFVLSRAACGDTLKAGGRAAIRLDWINRGAGRCYRDFAVETAFLKDGKVAARSFAEPTPATSDWAPGKHGRAQVSAAVPADLAPGDYLWTVRLVRRGTGPERVSVPLASKGADADGRYPVGRVSVE